MSLIDESVEEVVRMRIAALDRHAATFQYWRQDELLVVDSFFEIDDLLRELDVVCPRAVRKTVPNYKSARSVSYFTLRQRAPAMLALYRSRALIDFLSEMTGEELLTCPDDDPHACAVYEYDRAGDRVGWHYDISWYEGARFTVLLGLFDDSSARLRCRLYTRDPYRPTREVAIRTAPGSFVFFNGFKVQHCVSPTRAGERRAVLTLQYVTDRRMRAWRRGISLAKDALTYFGLEALSAQRVTSNDSQ
jgi:hypothetical protein